MRILSWNINGIRTLPQYHPWNTFKSCEEILDELKADIICFQEMKSSRAILPRDVALPGPFHSFFSFPVRKGGYSGVAVYADSRKVIPHKAEEGLSGKLQPKPPLSTEERISPSYPYPHDIDLFADENGELPASFDTLDSEGRGLVIDFGLFVLINVYCPNETSEARTAFKMNYHIMLQERVRKLIEEEHREVIVLGDMNICAAPIDHCDGHLPSNTATFYDHPARAWFYKWLSPEGPMVDIVREYHPQRKGLFTCWNLKIQARETNYGTRVDYILVTKGLLPWICYGDIQPSLKGSDHCPIYIDLRDEITLHSGETLSLCNAMKQHVDLKEPPRIAAKFWDEFSGKQTVLSAFFGQKAALKDLGTLSSSTLNPPLAPTQNSQASVPTPRSHSTGGPTDVQPDPLKKPKPTTIRPVASTSDHKRKSFDNTTPSASITKKRKQSAKGQPSIASFFSKPSTASASTSTSSSSRSQKPPEVIEIDGDDDAATATSSPAPSQSQSDADQLDADYRLACALAAHEPSMSPSSPSQPSSSSPSNKNAWSSLFAPVQPPNCLVHNEPARLYTVNKQGPNKGKTFYLCSRPVGPGYDKGRGERLRDEVDHKYRCNFFKWASEVRKEAMREREKTNSQGT